MGAVKAAYLAAFDPPTLPATANNIGDGFESMAGAALPPGAVIPCNLLAATIAADFTAGLGDVGTAYDGWAICDGANGTPNLSNRFIRHKSTGASGTGGSDTSAHTHTLSSAGGAQLRYAVSDNHIYAASYGPSFTYSEKVDLTSLTPAAESNTKGSTPLVGATDAAAAVENRPAYYEMVYLMRV